MIIKDFIPPILLKLFHSHKQSKKKFKSYNEAFASCQDNAYGSDDLVQVIIEKNLFFKNSLNQSNVLFDLGTLRTLIAVGLSNNDVGMNVIDFGGGGGYHHTIASKALGKNNANLKWHIIETPNMVKGAQRIANKNLKFYDNVTDAAKDFEIIDLVFTSSALQYCPNPLLALKALTELNAKYLFITRTPFTESIDDLVTIQTSNLSSNGPGPLPKGFSDRKIKYPITYASRLNIENLLSEKYEIQFMTEEGEGSFEFANEKISMNGYFCVNKS
jgi:putative methyltransferase (TIGR04325 family)